MSMIVGVILLCAVGTVAVCVMGWIGAVLLVRIDDTRLEERT